MSIRDIIIRAARKYGVDPNALIRVGEIESGLNPNAKNPNSSAGGLFQFIDSTAAQYGLEDRFDAAQAADAAARLMRDNAASLRRGLGREPTGGELYLAHQQGAGGALRLLRDPNQSAESVVGSDAIRLNAGRPGMTAGEFAGLWTRKFGGGDISGGAGDDVVIGQQANDTIQPLVSDPVQIANIWNAYTSGRMDDTARAEYEEAVRSGLMPVPPGANFEAASTVQDFGVNDNQVLNIYNAYISGQMDPVSQREYLSAVQSGQFPTPPGSVFDEPDVLAPPRAPDPGTEEQFDTPERDVPFGALASEMSEGQFALAGEALQGFLGNRPSIIGGMLPESTPQIVRDVVGQTAPITPAPLALAPLGLAALGTMGGVTSGAAGLAGDVARETGIMSPNTAERFARDLASIPDAFAGSPTTLARPVQPIPRAPRAPGAAAVARGERVADAAETIRAGQQTGVRVMTSDVIPPETFAARWLTGIGEKIPVAGTAGARAQQVAQRQDAIADVVRQFSRGEETVDDILPLLSRDLISQRAKALTKYTTAKAEVIDRLSDAGPVDVTRTIAKIDDEIATLRGMRTEGVVPIIDRLEDWKRSIVGQDFRTLEDLRSQIGESFKSPDLAGARQRGEKVLSSIYAPLRQDMHDFIRANGEARDLTKWQVANSRLSEGMGELRSAALKRAVKFGDVTPESAGKLLFSQNKSDVTRLYRNMSPEGRANARAAIIYRALETSGPQDVISPTRFSSAVDKLARQTGVFFTGEDKAALDGLSRVLRATQRADAAAVSTPTGLQNLPFIGGAVLTDLFGGSAGAAVASTGGLGLIARTYESAPTRNALLAISRTRSGSPAEMSLILKHFPKAIPGAIAAQATTQGQENDN